MKDAALFVVILFNLFITAKIQIYVCSAIIFETNVYSSR